MKIRNRANRSPWYSGGGSGGGGGSGDIKYIIDITVLTGQTMQATSALKPGQFYRVVNSMANTWAVILMADAVNKMGTVGQGIYGGVSGTLFCEVTYNIGSFPGDTDRLTKVWDPTYKNYIEDYQNILEFSWNNPLWTSNRVEGGSVFQLSLASIMGSVVGNQLSQNSNVYSNVGTSINNFSHNLLKSNSTINITDCTAANNISFNTLLGQSSLTLTNANIGECTYNEIYGNSQIILAASSGTCNCNANTVGGYAQILGDANTKCVNIRDNIVVGNDTGLAILDLSGVDMTGFQCYENSVTNGSKLLMNGSVVDGHIRHNTLQGESLIQFTDSTLKAVQNNILSEEGILSGNSSTVIGGALHYNSIVCESTLLLSDINCAGVIGFNSLTGKSNIELPCANIDSVTYNTISGRSFIIAQAGTSFTGGANINSNTISSKGEINFIAGTDFTNPFSKNNITASEITFSNGSIFYSCQIHFLNGSFSDGNQWSGETYTHNGKSSFDIGLDFSDPAIFFGTTLAIPAGYEDYIGIIRPFNVPVNCVIDTITGDNFKTDYLIYGDTTQVNPIIWNFTPLPQGYRAIAADSNSWALFSHATNLIFDYLNYTGDAPVRFTYVVCTAGNKIYTLSELLGRTLTSVDLDNAILIVQGANIQATLTGADIEITDTFVTINGGEILNIYFQ